MASFKDYASNKYGKKKEETSNTAGQSSISFKEYAQNGFVKPKVQSVGAYEDAPNDYERIKAVPHYDTPVINRQKKDQVYENALRILAAKDYNQEAVKQSISDMRMGNILNRPAFVNTNISIPKDESSYYRNMSQLDLDTSLVGIGDEIASKQREINVARSENAKAVRARDKSHVDNSQALMDELNALQSKQAELQNEKDYRTYQSYMRMGNMPDFNEKSAYVSTQQKEVRPSLITGQYADDIYGDLSYELANKNPEARTVYDTNASARGDYLFNGDSNLLELSDDEVKVYNYLYATDKNRANEFLKFLNGDLNARQRERITQEYKQMAQDNPILSDIWSVVSSPAKSISALGQALDYLGDRKIDENAAYNRFSYQNSAIRDQRSEDIEKKWGKVGSFGYQTAMSMGDFMFNALITGNVGAGAESEATRKAAENLSLAIMGTGASADATIEAKDRGLNDNQAFALGAIAGFAEIITEHYSLEALLDKTSLDKNAIGYLLKNTVAEGSEEVASDLINTFADILITGDKSEWKQAVKAYEAQGLDPKKAFIKAFTDKAKEMGVSFLGGAISGGVMSAAHIGIRNLTNMNTTNASAHEIYRDAVYGNGEDLQQLYDVARSMEPGTRAYQLADKFEGNPVSENQVRRMVRANEWSMDYERQSAYDNAQEVAQSINDGNEVTEARLNSLLANPGTREIFSINEESPIAEQRAKLETSLKALASQFETGETNQSVNTITEDKPIENQRFEAIQNVADTLGENGKKEFAATINPTANVAQQSEAFVRNYNAGLKGDTSAITTNESMNFAEAQNAFKAGQMDADKEVITKGVDYVQSTNDSEERTAGVDRGIESSRVGKKSARAAEWFAEQEKRANDIRTEVSSEREVSSKEIGVQNGTDAKTIRVVPRRFYTKQMSDMERVAKSVGVEVRYFTGDMQAVRSDGKTTTVRGVHQGNTIYVRADHNQLSVDQIAMHELYHDLERQTQNEVDKALREKLQEHYTEKELDELVEAYVDAYGWEFMSEDDIWSEILADAYAGIDVFDYLTYFEGATRFDTDYVRGVVDDARSAYQARAPTLELSYSEDPRRVTEKDVRNLLSKVGKGEIALNSYIPVRATTPSVIINTAKFAGIDAKNVPMLMKVTKAFQAESQSGSVTQTGKGHGLSVDNIIEISRNLNDPEYILYDEARGHINAIVSYNNNGSKAYAVLNFDSNIDATYTNGYDGGAYNILVTMFSPDKSYLVGKLKGDTTLMLYDKNKKGMSQRTSSAIKPPSVLNDEPFYKEIISESGAKVKASEEINRNNFDNLYTVTDGIVRPKNANDLSTEDWKKIYKAVNKLGYGLESANQAKEVYSRYVEKGGFNKEQSQAILKEYGIGKTVTNKTNPERVKAAKKLFGTTTRFTEAGYLLPDGSMLDFSGKREGGPSNVRYMDHREIAPVFGEELSDEYGYGDNTRYMNAFIAEGNIRLIDSQGLTVGEVEPSAKQYSVLKRFIEYVLDEEGYFYLDISNNAGDTIQSREYGEADSATRILNDIKAYYKNGELPYRSELQAFRYSEETDSTGRKLSVGQVEYFKNSVARDSKGNLLTMYHGTNKAGFTVFRGWQYFTADRQYAQRYSRGTDGLYEVYANITKPFDTRIKECRDIFENEFYGNYSRTGLMESGLPDWTDGYDLVDFLEENGYDYDAIYLDEGGDPTDNGVAKRGISYVVRSSEQVKNVDNLNPTSNPDIRFSEELDRDYLNLAKNPTKNEAKLREIVDAAAKNAGYPIKAYHGTNRTFTEFKEGNAPGWGKGIYLTDSEEGAREYGKNIVNAFIKLENPYTGQRLNAKGTKAFADYTENYYRDIARREGISLSEAREEYPAPTVSDMVNDEDARFLNSALRELGYDGIAMENSNDITGTEYVVFSPEQVKSGETVTYDGAGNVIPLSRRFDLSNGDIRFSEDLPTALAKENEELRKQVNNLNSLLSTRTAQRDSAKAQVKLTETPTVRRSDVEKLARARINALGSASTIKDITDKMTALGNKIVQGASNGELVYEDLISEASDIAYDIISGVKELTNDTELETLNEIKKYFKGKKFYYDNLDRFNAVTPEYLKNSGRTRGEIQDYKNFRAKNLGRFTLTTDPNAIRVDSAWDELQEIFGTSFFPDIDGYSDKVQHISGLLDGASEVWEIPADLNNAETIQEEANYILNELIGEGVRQTAPTYADRMNLKLDRQAYNYEQRIAQIKESRDRQIQELKEKAKEKSFKQRDAESSRKIKARINKRTKELQQLLLKPTDKKHIPESLRGSVARLLEVVNQESAYSFKDGKLAKGRDGLPTKRTRAFLELKAEVSKYAGELVWDPGLVEGDGDIDNVISWADIPMDMMTKDQLETVERVVNAVYGAVRSYNKVFSSLRADAISDVANRLLEDNENKKERNEYVGALNRIDKLVNIDMLTPEAAFHRLGAEGDAIFKALRQAQDKHTLIMQDAANFTAKTLGKYDVRKSETTMHDVVLGGKKTKLSSAQIMELYNLYCRGEQAINHMLYGGGILPEETQQNGKLKKTSHAEPFRGVTMEELADIIRKLTPEEIRIADALRKFASTTLADYGNEASMDVYNYKKFGETDYWSIRTNKQDVKSSIENESQKVSIGNKGFTKAVTPKANTSILLGSVFDTFSQHTSDMATYSAYLAVNEDLMRVLNYTFRGDGGVRTGTVKGIMDRVLGKGGYNYFIKLMSDISLGIKGEKSYMGGLTGSYKAASVGSNLRVMIQQPTAILRALEMIDPKYLVEGMKPNDGWKKAVKYAPIAVWKDWGYFDTSTGRSTKNILFETSSRIEKVQQLMMAGAGKMDSIAWGQLWNACELETKDKHPELSGDALYKETAKRFSDIVDHTQVVDGILQRSQIMRSADGVTKMATSFMGEPTKQYNQLMSAIYDYKNGDKTQAKKIVRSVASLVVAGLMNAVAQSLVDAMRDDEPEKYWEKFIKAMFGITGDEESAWEKIKNFSGSNVADIFNPAGYIPFVKDVWSLIQGYDVERMDMSLISEVVQKSNLWMKSISGNGKQTILESTTNLFATLSKMTGLSIANIKRDLTGILNTYAIQSDNFLMQYEMMKLVKRVNFDSNRTDYYKLLYRASLVDPEAAKIIYDDLIERGYDPAKIESRMKSLAKDSGEYGFIGEGAKTHYDTAKSTATGSKLWKKADSAVKERFGTTLNNVTTNLNYDSFLADAKRQGISEEDYILFRLALDVVDEPTEKKGEYQTYTLDEMDEAFKLLKLSNKEEEWLKENRDSWK